MDWKFFDSVSKNKQLGLSGLVLVSVPMIVKLVEALSPEASVVSMLFVFEPVDLALPGGLTRLYFASAIFFLLQSIVRIHNAVSTKVPADFDVWKTTISYRKAVESIRKSNRRGSVGLGEAIKAEHIRLFDRKKNELLALRGFLLVLLIVSGYLVLVTLLTNAISVIASTELNATFFPFWGN